MQVTAAVRLRLRPCSSSELIRKSESLEFFISDCNAQQQQLAVGGAAPESFNTTVTFILVLSGERVEEEEQSRTTITYFQESFTFSFLLGSRS